MLPPTFSWNVLCASWQGVHHVNESHGLGVVLMHGFDLLPSVEGGIAFKEVHLDEGRTRDRQEFGLDLVARVLRHKGKAYSHNIVERPNSSRIRHERWKAVYLNQ